MPAITPADATILHRVDAAEDAATRAVIEIADAPSFLEGEGFKVRRATAGLDLSWADPFLMLDHMGAVEYAPGEAKGAPDHPHRGFETVTYMLDGRLRHLDSHGGGGILTAGATGWMAAGSGVVHSEMPTQELLDGGGLFHGFQLWVNLPSEQKWLDPRYQDLEGKDLGLVASEDAGAVVRLIAGSLGGVHGPGDTQTPITYAHATLAPGARLRTAWRPEFNALVYIVSGRGAIGAERRPIHEGQIAVLGPGEAIEVRADPAQDARNTAAMDVLLLGGLPIREQIAWYGPFVMNTRDELVQAVEDYQSGRMGAIPPDLSRT